MEWYLILLSLLIIYELVKYIKFMITRPPGPFPVPFFWNAILMVKLRYLDKGSGWYPAWIEYAETLGHYFAFVLPFDKYPYIVVTRPEDVEYLLKTNFENFQKGPPFKRIFGPLLGDGIFNMDHNELWRVQRKTASNLFKNTYLRYMVEVFVRHGLEVIELLHRYVDSGEVVDLQELFMRFTLDSICEIAFGQHLGSLNNQVPFAESFTEASRLTEDRYFNPLWRFIPAFLLSSEKDLKKHVGVVDQLAYKIIEEKKANLTEFDTDVLGRMMNMKDENGEVFTDKFLRDVILNFVIAGRDTTAHTLAWCTLMLSKNRVVEEKLLDEIKNTVRGTYPTFETSRDQDYFRAVMDETLRLYPAVPADPKYVMEDDVFPSGVKVEKGWSVSWSAFIMGRSKNYWDTPEEFRPERFIDPIQFNGGKEISSYTHVPFQAGPRICLGKEMAVQEVTTLLSMLLPIFKFEPVEDHPIKLTPGVTLGAQGGILFRVSHR